LPELLQQGPKVCRGDFVGGSDVHGEGRQLGVGLFVLCHRSILVFVEWLVSASYISLSGMSIGCVPAWPGRKRQPAAQRTRHWDTGCAPGGEDQMAVLSDRSVRMQRPLKCSSAHR